MFNPEKPKIAILCSGLDSKLRGYETHQRTLFECLKVERCDVKLFKRTGKRIKSYEVPLRTPSEDSLICKLVSLFYETPHQLQKSFFSVAFVLYVLVFRKKFKYLLIIEPGVARVISRIRKLLPGNPDIVYTHGIGNGPEYYFGFSDQIIEVSNPAFLKAHAYASKKESSQPLHCIPHFVNQEFLFREEPDAEFINSLKKKFGIQTRNVALHVGLICKDPKNVGYIIEEIARLPKDWSLLLVGEVEDSELLNIGKHALGDRFLQITLPRDRVREAYYVSDVMVFASINEGFGIVIIEGLSSGLPVLLPNIPLYQWIVNSNNDSLYNLESGGLSNAIQQRMTNPNLIRKQKETGRLLVQANYSWNAVRKAYLSLLK